MAGLNNLTVFNEFVYTAMTEVLMQQVDLFNSASRNTIQLSTAAHLGDYSESTMWAKISGLVRRRDAYGSGAVAAKEMSHLNDVGVKIAAGTPPIEIDPSQMLWIQRSPEEMAAVIGQQLAIDALADMLNTSIGSCYAALAQADTGTAGSVVYDGTAGVMSPTALANGSRLFGDRYSDIVAWVMHSKVLHDHYIGNLANVERLFQFGSVNIIGDAFGRVFVVSDSSSLIATTPVPDEYHTLGLTAGAIRCDQNNDFISNIETSNGDENILRTFQAEWSWNLSIKGFKWDKTNGGASPDDAALILGTNWDGIDNLTAVSAEEVKRLAGIVVDTQ